MTLLPTTRRAYRTDYSHTRGLRYDSADDIMSRANRDARESIQRRIERCAAEIAALRRQANPKREDVEGLAGRLGRKARPKMGSEPRYENEWFPDLPALFIPNKSPLRQGTAGKILNQLEVDLSALRRRLEQLGGPIDDAD